MNEQLHAAVKSLAMRGSEMQTVLILTQTAVREMNPTPAVESTLHAYSTTEHLLSCQELNHPHFLQPH